MNKVIDPRLNFTAPLAVHPAVERAPAPPQHSLYYYYLPPLLLLLFLDVQAQSGRSGPGPESRGLNAGA
jgi:hypothetical protein